MTRKLSFLLGLVAVLVIGADKLTAITNWKDRNTCVLFGDGAGAAVLANSPSTKRKIAWKASGSLLKPVDRDLLRFEQKAGMLRNILTPQVPALCLL